MAALTLTCGEVAEALGFLRRDGSPNRSAVRKLARDGAIPPPIDTDLALCYWRWSRHEIEAYARGEWKPRRAS